MQPLFLNTDPTPAPPLRWEGSKGYHLSQDFLASFDNYAASGNFAAVDAYAS